MRGGPVRACMLAASLGLAACGGARTSESLPRCEELSLTRDARGARLSVPADDLFADAADARAALEHDVWVGPAVTLLVRVEGFRVSDGGVVATARRRCRLMHDAWAGTYTLEVAQGSASALDATTVATPAESVDRCVALEAMPVGDAHAFDPGASTLGVRVSILSRPVDSEMLHRLRHWLARPDGASSDYGQLFGTVVGLLVSRSSLAEPDPLAGCELTVDLGT